MPVPPHRFPATFWLGLLLIAFLEVLLSHEVHSTHRSAFHSTADVRQHLRIPPAGPLDALARWVAVNMTALAWPGYLLMLDGILVWQTGTSPIRRRPHHFALLCIASVFIWSIFDWINFYFIDSWRYIGLPEGNFWITRFPAYAIAFAAVVPGMLLSAQVFLNAGLFNWAHAPAWRMPRFVAILSFIAGAVLFAWPFFSRDPISNLGLWASLVFMLDPINLLLGRPSIFADWQAGRFDRTLAAFAGGLICGLLWEFWNYWALAKWAYHLPFLGRFESYRYFEMPLLGLFGFLPFALECWVMWQTMRIPLDGLAEPLPDDRHFL